MRSRVFSVLLLLVLLVGLVESADAQRRRRRRPRPPQETQQTEPQGQTQAQGQGQGAQGDEPPAVQDNPFEGEAGGDEGGAAPAQATEAEAGGADARQEGADPAEGTPEEGYASYAPVGPDLAPLRSEFTSIMDELVQVRSRMAVLGRQLFRTKVRIRIHNRAGDDNNLSRLVVSLDGAPVHRGDGSDVGEDAQQVFEGFAAPGPHVLTVEVEQRQRADDDYRYTVRDSFRFLVERERLTEITVTLDDDSDMGEDFEDDGEAEYDVSTRVRVATRDLER